MSDYDLAPDAIAPDSKDTFKPLKPLDTVVAIYDYPGNQPYSLPLTVGDTVHVLSKSDTGWWDGVLSSSTGTSVRGWFPHTYTRSSVYHAPTNDVDSITAANTAANTVIPSYPTLLQKNLQQDYYPPSTGGSTSRKNSAVSFASSETSFPAEYSKEAHTKYSEISITSTFHSSTSEESKTKKVVVLSLSEVEEMLSSYSVKNDGAPIWIPTPTVDGNLVFYSDQLNVYCEQAPFIMNQELNSETNINFAQKEHVTRVEPMRGESETKMSMSSSRFLSRGSEVSYDRQNSAISRSPSLQDLNHSDGALLADPELFYIDPTDIVTWSGLEQSMNFLLTLTANALAEHNKQMFLTHYNTTSRLFVLVQLAARLIESKLLRTNFERSITRKLKRIAGSIAQLHINSSLHLSIAQFPQKSEYSIDTRTSTDYRASSTVTLKPDSVEDDLGSSKDGEDSLLMSGSYLDQAEQEITIIRQNVNAVIKILYSLVLEETGSQEQADMLPQVYPRFLLNEFNGGNWSNPFFGKDSEDRRSKASKRNNSNISQYTNDSFNNARSNKILIDREAYEQVKSQTSSLISPVQKAIELLNPLFQERFYNNVLMEERNTDILRIIYKSLASISKIIDIFESFDFTIFSMVTRSADADVDGENGNNIFSFNYPVVLEFFEMKQDLHNVCAEVIMSAQSLTLDDPEVFKGLLEDDPILYNKKVLELPIEMAALKLKNILIEQDNGKGDMITINTDAMLTESLEKVIQQSDLGMIILQQLIEERETILNYSTRMMQSDFNMQLLVSERNNTIQSERSEESQTFMTTNRRVSRDIPWYLDGDEEYDLAFDAKGNVKGGTKAALVAHLTHHDLLDSNYNVTFLNTFPSMMTLGELVDLITTRFNIIPPDGLSYEEYNSWVEKKLNPIRLRVMNIMKMLLERYWSGVLYDEKILKSWLVFAKSPAVQKFSFGGILKSHLETILNGGSVCHERNPILSAEKPPASLIKGYNIKKMKLTDIDYVEFARQLTLKEFNLYFSISKLECLSKVWGRKYGSLGDTQNIINFISNSNQLTNYVAYMILRKHDVKKRVQVIRFFIQVAEKCRQYNNFSSMTAIISALYSSPIHRLQKTWKIVSQGSMNVLQNMNRLMNSTRNFNEYRDMLKFVQGEACIPFFGVYLSDLTFTYQGNPDFLQGDTQLINFSKRAKTNEIILNIEKFKIYGYNFAEVKEIQNYIDSWFGKCPSIDEQYSLSLSLEPRETASSTLKSKEGTKGSISRGSEFSSISLARDEKVMDDSASISSQPAPAKKIRPRQYGRPFIPIIGPMP